MSATDIPYNKFRSLLPSVLRATHKHSLSVRETVSDISGTSAVLVQSDIINAPRVQQHAESTFYTSDRCVNEVKGYQLKDSYSVLLKGIPSANLSFHTFLKLLAEQLGNEDRDIHQMASLFSVGEPMS
jgi:hypothetical protein